MSTARESRATRCGRSIRSAGRRGRCSLVRGTCSSTGYDAVIPTTAAPLTPPRWDRLFSARRSPARPTRSFAVLPPRRRLLGRLRWRRSVSEFDLDRHFGRIANDGHWDGVPGLILRREGVLEVRPIFDRRVADADDHVARA